MKKVILIIFLLGVIVVGAATAFVLTFDLNRYRPQIEKQAAAMVGNPVKIGNLSLAWRKGLAIRVDGAQVLSNDEPVLVVQSAGAVLQIAPLLRRSIQIATIFLDGADIRVVKTENGKIEIQGLKFSAPDSALRSSEVASSPETLSKSSSPTASSAWASFLIGDLSLRDVHVRYEDDVSAFPVQLDLRNLELTVKNISLFRPMEFQAAAAVFGAKQNVQISGRLRITDQGSRINAENLKAEVDLGALDLNELARSLPKLKEPLPVSSVSGKLKADVQQLSFKDGGLKDFEADLALNDGEISAWGASPLLDRLQVNINRFRLNEAVDFKIKSAVFSDNPNWTFQGRFEMGQAGRMIVGPAQMDFDLERLNWNRVEALVPAVHDAGFLSPPEGRMHAEIRRFDFDPKRVPSGDADFRYDQGRLRLKSLPQELSAINLTGTLRGDQLNLDAWNINFGASPAEGRLNIQKLFTSPIFRSEIRARAINLVSVLPPPTGSQPTPEGVLSFELSVGGQGKTAEVIIPSLTGSGHFRIENPVIRNFNALEQVLTKLSAIPGLKDALSPQRLSEKLRDRLDKRDTTLQTIDQEFSVQNQSVYFTGFEAISSDFRLRGPATLRIDGELQAQPTIWIHEEIMAELAGKVNELAFALNPQGQLQIPLSVSGKAPQIAVVPDVQFLLGEMVRNRSNQVAGQLAQRIASGKGPGKISQILGVTPYDDSAAVQTTAEAGQTAAATATVADNSVPVKVYSGNEQKPQTFLDTLTGTSSSGQPVNRKAQLAAGILNTLLSSETDSSGSQQGSAGGNS